MCGIAGFAGRGGRREEREAELRAMCATLVHRGPDDDGLLVRDDVALGMRRLSIIDVEGGAQPIGNEDGSVQVVFNGEIYNFRELKRRLEDSGHRFGTQTDTEVLVHLYEDHGPGMLEHLRGMFAFALWDARRRRLFLARDRLGIKPLYYWDGPRGLAFSSELKALRELSDLPRSLDLSALADYLALGYVPDPDSIYRGVKKLPPGHRLVWEETEGARVERWWNPLTVEERPEVDEEDAAERLRELLLESVRYRLISDVPLGAFLSGGTDSSAVVAAMARQTDRPVRTFSIGFEEPGFNEAPDAARVARALDTEHTELVVRPDVNALVEDVVEAFDEPFADSSAIPTLLVSRLARDHVTVALSGDGGDELFGGYTRYRNTAKRSVPIPAPARRLLGSAARRLPQGAYGRNRLLEFSRSVPGRYATAVAEPLAVAEGGVARPRVVEAGLDPDRLLLRWWDQADGRGLMSRMMLVDLLSYLPGDILTKVDRMSMAASLEARVPLLDHRMVEYSLSLPSSLKFGPGGGKRVFRKALEGLVPDFVFQKPKHGFGVPLRPWFRRELAHRCEELLDPGSPVYEFVDPDAVGRIVEEHQAQRRDHSHQIWRLLVLQIWLRSEAGESGAG